MFSSSFPDTFGRRALRKTIIWAVILLVIYGLIRLVGYELKSSRLQAHYLTDITRELTYKLEPGASKAIRFPKGGPYDERLGYSQIPFFLERLATRNFHVTQQARLSPKMLKVLDKGFFAIYQEKPQGGLDLLDCNRHSLYSERFPERVYDRFDAVPPLLVNSLLFIENRQLLENKYPTVNPALEWKRFMRAILDNVRQVVDDDHNAPGGSTLATQIEKYRHSPEGRTTSGTEKLRQMVSASLRAYLNGENTLPMRKQIVVDYLNTVPLSAKPGYGEVNGMGDGLWAWYGRDFSEVNRALSPAADEAGAQKRFEQRAQLFKEALSLMIAQRRPGYYLHDGVADLETLTNSHLRLLASEGFISPTLRDAALPLTLKLRPATRWERPSSFVSRKASTALRAHLSGLLNVPRLYDLDRLDLVASTTLNAEVQKAVTQTLRDLRDPAAAKAAGLYGFRLLDEDDDPSKLIFSFTLYERGQHSNLLRVQTDNFDQPFDLNEGAKLDLGSTSKFRTLLTYLEVIEELHSRYVGMTPAQLAEQPVAQRDVLRHWVLDYLANAEDKSLPAILEAAMQRQYSGNPGESFFTGGGLHTFGNFDRSEDSKNFTVREGFQHSVNLLFVRMMRDIVRYYMYQNPSSTARLLEDKDHPLRQEYLSRFADREGKEFIARFHKKYRGKTADEALTVLMNSVRPVPRRLAAIFRTIEPAADFKTFSAMMAEHLPEKDISESTLQDWYDKFGTEAMSLADRGYVAGIHPLELWLVGFLRQHPGATLSQAQEASGDERQAVYVWLFKTRHKNAQDSRIQSLLEVEAFLEIARAWKRLGYPFESLTPSYAASLGASGDRPAALAELMGIIVNKGLRFPITKVDGLQFAAGTPYETHVVNYPAPPERVLSEEVASIARRSLLDVVSGGTARRLDNAFVLKDGSAVEVGGKTGTGDHRYDVYGRGGQLTSSRVVSRTGTFMFLIGDRYFGTMVSYVREPYAANYKFTSAFSSQILKSLAPVLTPLFEKQEGSNLACKK